MPEKLVRDLIPFILRRKGLEPDVTIAGEEEYWRALRAKLSEETTEYLDADEAHAVEELADVLEVVYALAGLHGTSPKELERIRQNKADERGGFTARMIWHGNR